MLMALGDFTNDGKMMHTICFVSGKTMLCAFMEDLVEFRYDVFWQKES
jgi:hypothetical protein